MFIEILFKILLFKGGVLIYAEHCIYIIYICICVCVCVYIYIYIYTVYTSFVCLLVLFLLFAGLGCSQEGLQR